MLYGVYRLYDVQKIDHSGNRECKGYYDAKADAQMEAERLNREEAEHETE